MIIIVIFGLLAYASGESFKFPSSGEACERIELNAVFNLTDHESMSNKEFTLNNAKVEGSGVCANSSSMSMMILTLEKLGKLKLQFVSDGTDVTLNPTFTFEASDYFNNSTAGSVALSGSVLDLGSDEEAYVCDSQMEITFKEKFNFSMTIRISEVKMQAFNMENGEFATEHHCPEDPANSTEAPTQGPTSEMPSSEAPTMEPSTAAPPKANMYQFKKDGKTCIEMDSSITLDVMYKKNDSTTATEKIMVPASPTTTVTGMCGNSTAQIVLEFTDLDDKNATRKVIFEFEAGDDNIVSLRNVTADVMINFPDAATHEDVAETKDENRKLADKDTYFTCESYSKMPLGMITVDLQSLKVQAFMMDGNFSGQGEDCTTTTMSPASTTQMSPTPDPKNPPQNTWGLYTKNGSLCIYLDGKIEFTIDYAATGDKTKTVVVAVPLVNETTEQGKITGDCGEMGASSQWLNVEFYDGWELTLQFDKSGNAVDLAADANFDYQLEYVNFTYKMQSDIFPDAVDKDKMVIINKKMDKDTFKASSGGSFKCNSDETLKLNDSVQMKTSDFNYKAFVTNNQTKFDPDNMTECPADTETNSIVPIAVGAALAGLVVIVLIAYLIGRRRSRKGYESV